MSEPPSAQGPQGEVSEEELRAYIGQMRQTPAEQLIADVFSALANGAQVKLGRRDARLLIDLAALLPERAGEHLEQRVRQEMTQVITQLRMAQVDAEKQLAQARAAGQEIDEANDLASGPSASAPSADAPAASQQSPPPRQQPPQQSQGQAASRLWIPGRP
jgi:hypothetical protein